MDDLELDESGIEYEEIFRDEEVVKSLLLPLPISNFGVVVVSLDDNSSDDVENVLLS